MLLSSIQAGTISAGGVLLAAKTIDTQSLIIAGITFAISFAKNIEAYLAELPPIEAKRQGQ
jgi:hypothetical protein